MIAERHVHSMFVIKLLSNKLVRQTVTTLKVSVVKSTHKQAATRKSDNSGLQELRWPLAHQWVYKCFGVVSPFSPLMWKPSLSHLSQPSKSNHISITLSHCYRQHTCSTQQVQQHSELTLGSSHNTMCKYHLDPSLLCVELIMYSSRIWWHHTVTVVE